jgi:hypothetical protein
MSVDIDVLKVIDAVAGTQLSKALTMDESGAYRISAKVSLCIELKAFNLNNKQRAVLHMLIGVLYIVLENSGDDDARKYVKGLIFLAKALDN